MRNLIEMNITAKYRSKNNLAVARISINYAQNDYIDDDGGICCVFVSGKAPRENNNTRQPRRKP